MHSQYYFVYTIDCVLPDKYTVLSSLHIDILKYQTWATMLIFFESKRSERANQLHIARVDDIWWYLYIYIYIRPDNLFIVLLLVFWMSLWYFRPSCTVLLLTKVILIMYPISLWCCWYFSAGIMTSLIISGPLFKIVIQELLRLSKFTDNRESWYSTITGTRNWAEWERQKGRMTIHNYILSSKVIWLSS